MLTDNTFSQLTDPFDSSDQRLPTPLNGSLLLATLTHVAVMTACLIFLAQSDKVTQSLAAVGIAAFLASMASHVAFPSRSSLWYWISPLLVGVAGYVIAYVLPTGLAIGFPANALGALARPTPLAYAAAGPVGSIFGFWVAYRWNTDGAV
jgi:hypothetical protein